MNNNEKVIKECIDMAFRDNKAFPEIVNRLQAIGVERYYVDLVRMEKIYYFKDGGYYEAQFGLKDPVAIEKDYSEEGVRLALEAFTKGQIDYAVFLKRMMESGVACCFVFFKSKQVVHFGRGGEQFVEPFPEEE